MRGIMRRMRLRRVRSSMRPGPGDPQGACAYPAPAGTIVIDDATGDILGVYPDSGSFAPHPSPKVPAPPG